MAITMYDLAGAEADRRFSPVLLAHQDGARPQGSRGRDHTVAVHRKGQAAVSPITAVCRSSSMAAASSTIRSAIADYLETRYPDRPSLFGDADWAGADPICAELDRDSAAAGVGRVCRARHLSPHRAERPGLFPAIARGTVRHDPRKCRQGPRRRGLPAFRESLAPLRRTVERQQFLGGASPPMLITLSSARFSGRARSAISSCSPPTIRLPRGAGRMLDAFGGLARKTPAYGV